MNRRLQFSLKALLVATGLLAAVLAFWRRSDEQSVTTVPIGELGKTHGAPTQYRLLPNCGLVSDDTEHACMVAQALIAAGDDADRFANELGRRLRKWLLGAPAGIGLATLKASVRLCLGVPPYRSGVFSAGNGPAMRSPLLGAAIGDVEELRRFVRLSTRVTHTDPKAEWGAMAVALAARAASQTSRVEPHGFASELRRVLDEPGADEMHELIHKVAESVAAGASTESFAASLGLERGVSGYIYHTVPVVLHAWLANPGNFRAAVTAVICCGGDADTTAAITGGIVGSAAGKEGIPADWLARFTEWPRTVAWMERLAVALCEARTTGSCAPPPRLPIYGVLPRNAFFASLVLGHGFRRLLPPY